MQRTGKINFTTPKLKCIIDFAICIPELLTQSVTISRILKGFIQAGMIDKKTNHGNVCPRQSLADCHGWAMCLSADTLRQGRVVKL